MKLKVVQFIALFLLMLVTGVFWGTWFTLTRSMQVFSPDCFLAIGKTIISNIKTPMQILMPSTILLIMLLIWLKFMKGLPIGLLTLSLTLLLLVLAITLGIEVPIDNQIKNWTIGTVPANWENIRVRWQFFHTFRTFVCCGSFFFLLLDFGSLEKHTANE